MPHVFPPSRGETQWRAAGYGFTAAIGFYTFFWPSVTVIEHQLGIVAAVWSLFMVCAVPAAIAAMYGRYRIESVLLPVFGSALGAAVVNAWIRVFVESDLDLIPRVCASSALLCLLVVRGLQLHRIVKAEPWITTGP